MEIQRVGCGDTWFYREAMLAIERGHYKFIPSRDGSELYLGRFWLSQPTYTDKVPESAESLMLHAFVRGDDDAALHNHPWETFETTILHGGYTECLPPEDWDPNGLYGPAWNKNKVVRRLGETIKHDSGFHCVLDVEPLTWTLIRTGKRVGSWGFHPEGQLFVPWRTYLGIPETEPEN